MSEPIDYQSSIDSLKIKFKRVNFLSKYFLLIAFVLLSAVSFAGLCSYGNLFFGVMFTAIVFMAVLTFIAILINDKLVQVNPSTPLPQIRAIIEKEIERLGWRIDCSNKEYLIAIRPGKWLPGNKITILFYKTTIFINVRNLPGNGGYFPFSFGKNKRITQILIRLINPANM